MRKQIHRGKATAQSHKLEPLSSNSNSGLVSAKALLLTILPLCLKDFGLYPVDDREPLMIFEQKSNEVWVFRKVPIG